MRIAAALLAVLALASPSLSCTETTNQTVSIEPTLEDGMDQLALLEAALRKLIGEPLCSDDSQCHAAPLGVKPCGGPWKYLIYSTLTVDVDLLQSGIEHYNAINEDLNRRHHLLSDCAIVPNPLPVCSSGVCAARN